MHIIHVFVRVKPDMVETFKAATLENARESIKEPGIARFDVLQQQDDPTRFVLVEAYRTTDDPARHKETPHYNKWRETVEPLLTEPRTRLAYNNLYPEDASWG